MDIAVEVYLTSNLSPGDAAGKAAENVRNTLNVSTPGQATIRNRLSGLLKNIPRAELLARARALRTSGRDVRLDIFPEIAADIEVERQAAALHLNMEKFSALLTRISISTTNSFSISQKVRDAFTRISNAATHTDTAAARLVTSMERLRRVTGPDDFLWLTRFTDAFPGLVPDDMPVSVVHSLRSNVELYLREEAEAWKQSSTNL